MQQRATVKSNTIPTVWCVEHSERTAYTGYQSTRHTVISSRGHVVTRSTRHRSTRHIHISSHSQLVTSEHITKPPVPVVIILSARRQETSRNIAQHGVITAICVTLMYTADYRSRQQITLM